MARVRRVVSIAVGAAALAIAGCGGLSDEDREVLDRLRAAEGDFESLTELEVELDAGLECLTFRGDLGAAGAGDDRIAVATDCVGATVLAPDTVVVVGDRAYVRTAAPSSDELSDKWQQAEIAPGIAEPLVEEIQGYSDVLDEVTDLDKTSDRDDGQVESFQDDELGFRPGRPTSCSCRARP